MCRAQESNEAPVCPCTGAVISVRPQYAYAQGLGVHDDPSALMYRGHEFNEAPVCSRTGAVISIRPHVLTHRGEDSKETQYAHAQGP